VGFCLLVIIALSCKVHDNEFIEATQREAIKTSRAKIKAYTKTIEALQGEINCLTKQANQFEKQKNEVQVHTITEVDSVVFLPFVGRSNFWATQAARLDTIRDRYTGRD